MIIIAVVSQYYPSVGQVLLKSRSSSQCLNRIDIQKTYWSCKCVSIEFTIDEKQKLDCDIWTDSYTQHTRSLWEQSVSCIDPSPCFLFCMNLDGWRFVNVPICGVYMWGRCFYEIVCNKLLIQLEKFTRHSLSLSETQFFQTMKWNKRHCEISSCVRCLCCWGFPGKGAWKYISTITH